MRSMTCMHLTLPQFKFKVVSNLSHQKNADGHEQIQFYIFARRNLSALVITETELKLIAAAAIIGDNNMPKNGNNTPAAIGTPAEL